MNSNDRNPLPPNRPRKPDDDRNWGSSMKIILIWVALLALVPMIYHMGRLAEGHVKTFDYSEFLKAVQEGRIKSVTISSETTGNEYATGEWTPPLPLDTKTDAAPAAGKPAKYKVFINLSFDRALSEELRKANIPVKIDPPSSLWSSFVMGSLPFLIPLLILWFLFARQMRSMGRGALSFGKSRARLLNRDHNRITFKDVAGVEEAKEEVQEIVEFLKEPKRFQKLGGRIPKGILMIGPPGTGKTLLAKAIAGEADVPFFSISGSDFVEMFVGVGASRVRDMFEQGRRNAPCLIFVDEIDAVGRSRFSGIGGGHDEREQTLNALLVEMDGFDTQEGIILIAATNRPDVLDPALLRPGRFDRQVIIDLPDLKGRAEILKVHGKKVKLAENVDLTVLARGTPGLSGADLANLINEAALLAARQHKKGVSMADLEEARDKVCFGRERRSRVMDDKDKEMTAYHEAGHAIVGSVLTHTEPVHKVTIIPRGNSLGSTMSLPEKDRYTYGKKKALDELTMYAAGRIAEEMVFGDINSGARGDIRGVSRIARKMVCEWGMSEKLGFIEYGESSEPVFVGREVGHARGFSEATAVTIDQEVRRIVDEACARASKILAENRSKLEVMARALLEYETLDGEHVKQIMEHGRLTQPPIKPTPPSSVPPVLAKPDSSTQASRPSPPPEDALPAPA